MKTITLSGSMRYAEEMKRIALELEIHSGLNVLQCVYNPQNIDLPERDRKALEEAHRKKIDLSDAIYVVDINGYIGDSVQKEIDYARKNGKEVIFHSQFNE